MHDIFVGITFLSPSAVDHYLIFTRVQFDSKISAIRPCLGYYTYDSNCIMIDFNEFIRYAVRCNITYYFMCCMGVSNTNKYDRFNVPLISYWVLNNIHTNVIKCEITINYEIYRVSCFNHDDLLILIFKRCPEHNNIHFPLNFNIIHKSYINLRKYQNKYSKMIKLLKIILGIWVITIIGINGLELRIYIELDISGWAAYSANTEYKNVERTVVITLTKIYSYLLPMYLYIFSLGRYISTFMYTRSRTICIVKCVVCTH